MSHESTTCPITSVCFACLLVTVSSWMATKSIQHKQKNVEAASAVSCENTKFDEIDFNSLYPCDKSSHMEPKEVVTESAHWSLSYNEIWKRLSRSANRVRVNRGRVSHYTVNCYAANNPIEDSYAIRTKLNTKGLSGMLFGVFDGHSGTNCSHFCRDELV